MRRVRALQQELDTERQQRSALAYDQQVLRARILRLETEIVLLEAGHRLGQGTQIEYAPVSVRHSPEMEVGFDTEANSRAPSFRLGRPDQSLKCGRMPTRLLTLQASRDERRPSKMEPHEASGDARGGLFLVCSHSLTCRSGPWRLGYTL